EQQQADQISGAAARQDDQDQQHGLYPAQPGPVWYARRLRSDIEIKMQRRQHAEHPEEAVPADRRLIQDVLVGQQRRQQHDRQGSERQRNQEESLVAESGDEGECRNAHQQQEQYRERRQMRPKQSRGNAHEQRLPGANSLVPEDFAAARDIASARDVDGVLQ